MWTKDSHGNWYIDGENMTSPQKATRNGWTKDGRGNWILFDETSFVLKKTPA